MMYELLNPSSSARSARSGLAERLPPHSERRPGWAAFGSTTARGTVYLAAAGPSGPWYLALDHSGVIEELGLPAADVAGPGRARFAFNALGALYDVLRRVYELGVSLPDAPLKEFEAEAANLPRTTEAERLVVQRLSAVSGSADEAVQAYDGYSMSLRIG